jgi:hypothetical protein
MKTIFTILAVISLVSCDLRDSDGDEFVVENNLLGSWQLIEVLVDPGDGSGVYNPVISEQVITFLTNDVVNSNTPFCNLFGEKEKDIYSGIYDKDIGEITPDGCDDLPNFKLLFEISGSHLIIRPLCIEPCGD